MAEKVLAPVTAQIDGKPRTFKLKMRGMRELLARMQQDESVKDAMDAAARGDGTARPELIDTLAFIVAMMVRHDGDGGIPDASPDMIMDITEVEEIPGIIEAVGRLYGGLDEGKATAST
jgi:hypothetical protein